MATIQQSVVALTWAAGNPAAATSDANLAFFSATNGDVLAIPMPCAGALVGLSVAGGPASGDTVIVTPYICTDQNGTGGVAVTALATTITNAAKTASTVISKDTASAQFAAGQCIQLKRRTTTGGTYTAHDVVATLYIQTGLEDL